jgi:hypothetical protein
MLSPLQQKNEKSKMCERIRGAGGWRLRDRALKKHGERRSGSWNY